MATQEKIRCGKSVWTRESVPGQVGYWIEHQYPSISQAKRANGLNSRTVESPKNLPAA